MGLSFTPASAAIGPCRLPEPEEIFLSWLMAQPAQADLGAAAKVELDRLDRYDGRHPGPQKLGELFRELRRSLVAGSMNRA